MLCGFKTVAQKQDVQYINKSGYKQAAPADAYFFEIVDENEKGGGTRTRFLAADSSKVSLYTYSDLDGGKYKTGIRNGDNFRWHPNGQLADKGYYSDNKLEGMYQNWHQNGQLQYVMQYKGGLLQDTLKGYDEQGRLRRLEVYQDDKMLAGEVYGEDGAAQDFFPMRELPIFPGGEANMLRFLSQTIKYPKKAIKAKIAGLVVLSFMVQENGQITDLDVIKTLSPETDQEAVRVVQAMPAWEPGKEEGKPVAMRFVLPVRYSIN